MDEQHCHVLLVLLAEARLQPRSRPIRTAMRKQVWDVQGRDMLAKREEHAWQGRETCAGTRRYGRPAPCACTA
eukprot:7383282-Prymnesium_polylepis.1